MKSIDIRLVQIWVMLSLLMTGVFLVDFSIHAEQILLTFAFGILAQIIWQKVFEIKQLSFLSTLITCFGISLLLRSSNLYVHPLAVSVAVSSKFLLRWKGAHYFNPAAFGVVVALIFFPESWVSPGQWGFSWPMAATLFFLGLKISFNANRGWLSFKFILVYFLAVLLRDYWLGWEWDVTAHKFFNGSLLLFTFFMISDPKTSPRHHYGQTLQAVFVAGVSFFLHYVLYWNNAFVYALIFSTPLVLICNLIWKADEFRWFSVGGKSYDALSYSNS